MQKDFDNPLFPVLFTFLREFFKYFLYHFYFYLLVLINLKYYSQFSAALKIPRSWRAEDGGCEE